MSDFTNRFYKVLWSTVSLHKPYINCSCCTANGSHRLKVINVLIFPSSRWITWSSRAKHCGSCRGCTRRRARSLTTLRWRGGGGGGDGRRKGSKLTWKLEGLDFFKNVVGEEKTKWLLDAKRVNLGDADRLTTDTANKLLHFENIYFVI